MEAGLGACQASSVAEVDGWYIDLRTIRPPAHHGAVGVLIAGQSGCRDHFASKNWETRPRDIPLSRRPARPNRVTLRQ
jgi:hypothetical protein